MILQYIALTQVSHTPPISCVSVVLGSQTRPSQEGLGTRLYKVSGHIKAPNRRLCIVQSGHFCIVAVPPYAGVFWSYGVNGV